MLNMTPQLTQTTTLTLSQQAQLAIKLLGLSQEALDATLQAAATANPLLRVPERDAEHARRIRRLERGAPRRLVADDTREEFAVARTATLTEHLLAQLGESDLFGAERRFALLVFGNLDARGWLDLSDDASTSVLPALTVTDLAVEAGLDPDDAEEVLAILQRFDPVGVATRTLEECLRVQAEAHGFGDLEITIIRHHLDRVQRRQYHAVARCLGVDDDTVREAVEDIATLDPRPARAFGASEAPALSAPEVAVRMVDGDYAVIDLSTNPYGLVEPPSAVDDRETRRFYARCRREATMLITAVERRRSMVLRVATEVLRRQRAFFHDGPRALRPLAMHDVAETLGVHESTVSRAVADKSMETPRGILPLRYFFRTGVDTGGELVANEAARHALRAIIAAEDARAPLSDVALAEALAAREGIRIARRTVAKYREQLGIAPSHLRGAARR